MLPYRHSKLSRILIVIFFLIVIGYAYYEARGMLYGPVISLPSESIQSTERFITVSGKAERINTLRMNGVAITVTEDGAFEEPYLLAPGLNRIIFDAEDKYGNTSQEVLQIVYTPSEDEGMFTPESTSTSSSTSPIAPRTR